MPRRAAGNEFLHFGWIQKIAAELINSTTGYGGVHDPSYVDKRFSS